MSLIISNLHVTTADQFILNGLSLSVQPGEIHAIMGPNGSGKSTLAYTLAGHPEYEVTKGNIELDGLELLELAPDERAQAGLFLAFQYPVEIPGLTVQKFLRAAYEARFQVALGSNDNPDSRFSSLIEFKKHLLKVCQELSIEQSLLKRGLNEGFSGGEKKRLEVLQLAVLQPKYAILDETDSGLDIDAIKIVAEGVNNAYKVCNSGVIIITHYRRILEYIQPSHVHIVKAGKITNSGGPELVDQIERSGYQDGKKISRTIEQ